MRMWKVVGTRRHNGAHPGAAGAHRLGDPCAGGGISAVAETLVLLRYVELQSRLFRLISLFKVREGAFDPTIRQFVITDRGIVVGEPFEGVEAILSGMPRAARNATLVSSEGSNGPTLAAASRAWFDTCPRRAVLLNPPLTALPRFEHADPPRHVHHQVLRSRTAGRHGGSGACHLHQ
jgi:hypothetical protein